ncbi:MAG TPA: hypothetical protein VGV57_13505 [Thermoleophilaceae bacterium]|nr:hypothetical protein [Thermoleophilaceae bacterium]
MGTTEALIDKSPSGTLTDYVSPNGELRARVRCTRSSGFYSRGDLLRISYDRP